MSNKPAAATEKAAVSKPELFPADLGGGDIQYIKRNDYAKRVADTQSIKLKSTITRAIVLTMLEALDLDKRDMPEDTPAEITTVFKIVTEDYDDAVQKVKDDIKKAADEKLRVENEAKEKQEKEESLVLSVKDKTLDFALISDKFDTGAMDRFIVKGDVSNEDVLSAFNASLKLDSFTGWMTGDLINELEKRGLENVVQRLAEAAGKSYAHIYNNAKTAKRFPPETRKPGVAFTIYREVGSTNFTPEQAKEVPTLVNEIAEGKHTTQTVRKAVQSIRGKDTGPVLPEDNEKKEFILVDPGLSDDPKQFITISKGFPKELVGGGVTIIDPVSGKMFAGMKKKPEDRWVEVPSYAKPEDPEDDKDKDKEKKTEQAPAQPAPKKKSPAKKMVGAR